MTFFERSGYTKETKFKVLVNCGALRKGDIVTLFDDDGVNCPDFTTKDGRTCAMWLPGEASIDELEVYFAAEPKTTEKVYIAGPMSGIDNFNRAEFMEAQLFLESRGYAVVNPGTFPSDETTSWHECMRYALKELLDCDKIYCLPGSHRSRGASLEMFIASQLQIEFLPENLK